MFCKKCGTEFADGSAFCPACGEPVQMPENPVQEPEQTPVDAPITEPVNAPVSAPAYAETSVESAAPQGNSGSKKTLGIVACILALLLIIVGIASCSGNNPKAVAKKYLEAELKFDVKAINYTLLNEKTLEKVLKEHAKEEDSTLKEYFEEASEQYDTKIKSVKDLLKASAKEAKEEAEDQYGKYSVSVKVIDAEKMDKDDLKSLKEQIKSDDGLKKHITASKIKEAYEVELEYTIKGKDDEDDDTRTLTLVKYGGSWKVFSLGFGF